MTYTYLTKGTCSSKIMFDYNNGKVSNIKFTGGCNGNLKAISALCEGMDADMLVARLLGNTCGMKSTSCADQLAQAVLHAMQEGDK